MRRINYDYLRNFIFGAEDSLVSTVGFLFGLASSSSYNTYQISLAGIVLIAVEALSMGAGSYLTETEVRELQTERHSKRPLFDGLIMFFTYFGAGTLTLMPYFFLLPATARFVSVGIALFTLFFLGFIPTQSLKSGLRMLVVAGGAILVGFLVAEFAKN